MSEFYIFDKNLNIFGTNRGLKNIFTPNGQFRFMKFIKKFKNGIQNYYMPLK